MKIFKRIRGWYAWFKSCIHIREDFGKFPKNSKYWNPIHIDIPKNIFVDEFVKIKNGLTIINTLSEKVFIKKYTVIAANVTIVTNNHYKTVSIPQFLLDSSHINDKSSDMVIEEDVWVGTGATLLCGTHLGRGCVVGAGAVVSKPVPPYAVVVGAPARIVKYVFTIDEILKHEAAIYPQSERMSREELEDIFSKYYVGLKSYGCSTPLTDNEQIILSRLKERWRFSTPC